MLSGEIVAGKKIKQAARRYKRDLKDSQNDDYPFYFDVKKANKAVKFCELLPAKDGSPLKLELYQRWIVSELFGWRIKETGNRRYDRAYISMSRKNGKSFLMSDLGAIYLLMENQPAKGREVMFTANSSAQAHLAFDMLASGLRQVSRVSPSLRNRLKINRDEIRDLNSESKAKPLASELHSLDGYQSDLAIVDEFALARSADILRTLKSGQIKSPNSLLAVISTVGSDLNGPMYKEYQFIEKVLSGEIDSPKYFVACFEQDSEAEAFDSKTWIKSNPLLSNAESAKTMIPSLKSDVEKYSAEGDMNTLYVKNFNMWRQASKDSYIKAEDWENAIIDAPDIVGKEVYIGIDLSKSSDLTSISWLVPYKNGIFVDSHSFVAFKGVGIEAKERADGFSYRNGEKRGECSITKAETETIDYMGEVLPYLLNLIQKNQWSVKWICYDPYGFDFLLPQLSQKFPLLSVRQGTLTLGQPTIHFREDLYNGKIKHSDNKLLGYAVNNAYLRSGDANNNPIIDKKRNANKIDPLAALITAYTAWHNDNMDLNEANNAYYQSNDFNF